MRKKYYRIRILSLMEKYTADRVLESRNSEPPRLVIGKC